MDKGYPALYCRKKKFRGKRTCSFLKMGLWTEFLVRSILWQTNSLCLLVGIVPLFTPRKRFILMPLMQNFTIYSSWGKAEHLFLYLSAPVFCQWWIFSHHERNFIYTIFSIEPMHRLHLKLISDSQRKWMQMPSNDFKIFQKLNLYLREWWNKHFLQSGKRLWTS